jgi:hypothetical protein
LNISLFLPEVGFFSTLFNYLELQQKCLATATHFFFFLGNKKKKTYIRVTVPNQLGDQGCQMVYFHTKNGTFGIFLRPLDGKLFVYVHISWPFRFFIWK